MLLSYKGLKIDIPYEAIQVEDINIRIQLNDHGYLYIKLLIPEGNLSTYIGKNIKEEKITVSKIYEGTESKIFVGSIDKVNMLSQGGVNIMELTCISCSKEFDIKKNSRTFCNLDMSYRQVISSVLNTYENKNFTDNITSGKSIGEFILQYEETDWEFIKRIASHFNCAILPEVTESYGRFHFGIPEISNGKQIVLEDYDVVKDIDNYNKFKAIKADENFLQEYTKWDIVSDKNLLLGEEVVFNEISCVVSKIEIEIYKEELRTIYTLGIKRGIRSKYKTNNKIFGMSIPAEVKEVKGNNMSVHFEIDEKYEECLNKKYFTYAIESSSWYCMPEAGSKVHIYFPTNNESDAIAVHAIRNTDSNGKYASKTQNPNNKSFSNSSGSEMQLTPSNMNFTAGAVALSLSQSGDVSLNGENINFNASKNMQLGMRESDGDSPPFRPKNIQISAKDKVSFCKGGTLGIEITDQTFLQGPVIKYEGTIKDSVPLPDEIAHRNDGDAETITAINNQAKEYEEQKVQEAKGKVGFGAIALAIGVAAIAVAATVATGGVAAAVIVAGATAAISGASKIGEGVSDYKKAVESGDFSQSYNFMRDTLMGGNQTLYDIVTYGSVIISGTAIAILTGGSATAVLKKTGLDMTGDVAFNMLADYADDGHINNGIMSYIQSASMSAGLSGVNVGVMNKFKKLEKAEKLSCKTIGRIRMASDVGLDLAGQMATTGDINITSTVLKKYVGNKLCFSDPVDGATGSLYIPATDIVLPDIHEEFKVERKYESVNTIVGTLGKGWTTNFESFLKVHEEKVTILCTDGHFEIFNLIEDKWVNDKGNSEIYTLNKLKDLWILKSYRDKKTYNYDELGKLKNIVDEYGNKLTITYIKENIETLTTFSNYKLYFTYKDNKVIQIKDELGRTVQYKYNGDYLTEVIHVDQGITRYTYNEEGYINSITDQNGQTYTKNFFDKKGRVIRQDFPNDDSCIITYDDSEREVSFYYKQSERTEKTRFNKEGLITHLFYEDETTEEYGYDEYQNKIYEKDRNGNITRREYNKYGSLIKEELPNGLIKEFIYDDEQNLLKEKDNLEKEILNTYDKQGNLLEKKTMISVGNWRTETYTYDSFGRILSKTDGNGNTSKYEYDIGSLLDGKRGKDPVRVTTNSGYEHEYEYDEVGRNTEIKTDYGTIEFGYNNLNFVSEIKDANGNITKKFYDKMGNIIGLYTPNSIINENMDGEGYQYKYDHMDRLISIKNPLGNIEKNIRDSEGNIIKEVNPNYYDSGNQNGVGIEYVYDKDNRRIKTIYPDGGIERLFYDSNGNVIKHISPEYYNAESDDGLGYSYNYDESNNLKEVINEDGKVEKRFYYDLHGNIIKATDIDGNATLYTYDLTGNLIEKKTPAECDEDGNVLYNVIYYKYDNNGNKILEKHGIDLISKDNVALRCHEINFAYDSENRLIGVSDKYGAKAKYKYDCLNHKIYESFKINDDTTKVVHYIYNKVGNLIEKKEEINGKFVAPERKKTNVWGLTQYEYDRNGNITKIITPKGYEIGRIYDQGDRVVLEYEIDSSNGIYRSKTYEYDKADNITSLSEYSGEDAEKITNKYLIDYDYNLTFFERYNKSKENDKLLEATNFEFHKKKKYKYDEQNRLTHFINFSGNTARLFYDKNDRIIKQVLPEQYNVDTDDGIGTSYKYNIKGQVVEVVNGLGKTVTQNIYDPKGNLKTSIDGENNKVEYTYTLLGQIKDISTPNSRKEKKSAQSYSYDARGNITEIIDGNGNETKYLLDDWGRIIQITTPEGGVEKYTYDYAGNITSTTDANGGTIEYFYNSLGKVSEIKDQEGNSEYFYYDEEGNLTKHIDRNKNHADRRYNIDNNIVELEAYNVEEIAETSLDEQVEARRNPLRFSKKEIKQNKLNLISQKFKYNPDGTLRNANFNNMYYNYEYNIEGMLESKSTSGKTLLSYTYDKNNNIKSIKDISGKSSIYEYDVADRVNKILDDNGKLQAEYEYYSNDNIKSVKLGNGVKSNYTYDGDGNVESLVTITGDGQVLVDYSYAYDLKGNRLQKVSSKHKNYYSYDSMNRLVDSSYDAHHETFTYDKVGNRLSKTTNDITEKYIYNVKNQLKEIHHKDGTNFFTYDKQGNTLDETHYSSAFVGVSSTNQKEVLDCHLEETNACKNIFEYNALNQQIKAITKDGNTLVNRYDSEGLRYEIEENEKLAKFIFNKNGDILVETDSDDKVVSRFTRGYEIVAADITDQTDSPTNFSLSRYYYSVDEQGSTDFITDKYGKIRNEYWYDAFGNVLESREDVHNRITYTGQQFDGITQQYYLRARFYNPIIGRFTQEDVYRGDGLNLYAYCGNNPVGYCDPSGYALSPKLTRSTVAKGDTLNAIQDALNGINLGEQGDGFVILKANRPKDKDAIKILDKNNLKGIWYRNKRPDFTPVSLFNVQIPNMSVNRNEKGGNYEQTRKAIAKIIIKHDGNFNKLMQAGVISEYATANTKKETYKFLEQHAKKILNSDLSEEKKIAKLSTAVKTKLEYDPSSGAKRYTIHEVNSKDVQLVPYEINARYNHDGGVSDCGKKESLINQCMKK